jgi:hypothetical protein
MLLYVCFWNFNSDIKCLIKFILILPVYVYSKFWKKEQMCLRRNPQFLKISLKIMSQFLSVFINSNMILTDTHSCFSQIHTADTHRCTQLTLTDTQPDIHRYTAETHRYTQLIFTDTHSCYSQMYAADTQRYTHAISRDTHIWYSQIHTAVTRRCTQLIQIDASVTRRCTQLILRDTHTLLFVINTADTHRYIQLLHAYVHNWYSETHTAVTPNTHSWYPNTHSWYSQIRTNVTQICSWYSQIHTAVGHIYC